MTTVLVALDGTMSSERAVPIARELAARSFADLVLVRSSWDSSEEEAAAYLSGVPERFGLEFDTRSVVVHGFPGDAVNELASEIDDAMICLTGHGRSAVGHYLLGGHSETILAHAPVPVVMVGPSVPYEWPRGDHLGLCVDAKSDPAVVAPFSAQWAARLGFEVDVLTMRAEDDRPVSRYHDATREQLDDTVRRIQAAGVRARSVVLKEVQPATRIARFASEHRLALLVAAKRHEGAARDFLGSTTMNLIHRSPCPVLVPPHDAIATAPPGDAVLEHDGAG
jgi:nucleotide-binding universal stress UspA family protein